MEHKGLLFIPDISGFTNFVNSMEIDHSRMIIQELLEILINANNSGLEISEIEGDAILFYKFGDPPSLDVLYKQVERMFCEFHKSLIAYNNLRYCQCKACMSVCELTLKIITHFGEFAGYRVKDFNKLIGKDLIVAHQLLKNDIPEHEYWLVTDQMLGTEAPLSLEGRLQWNTSAKQTENGQVPFHYTHLGSLRQSLKPEKHPQVNLSEKIKVFSLSADYETDLIGLFHAAGDFQYRDRWLEGVRSVKLVNHFLPRVGMKCECVMDTGETYLYASSYHYGEDKIEFSETDEKLNTILITLSRRGAGASMNVDYYVKKGPGAKVIFDLMNRRKMTDRWKKSLQNLKTFAKELAILESRSS